MKNLKTVRKNRGYSQAQLAQFVHVGSSTVCRWELGTTAANLYHILKLCCVLQCSPAQLWGDIPHNMLPVFDIDGNLVTTDDLTEELACCGCCFGLVVPCDISSRIKSGDICYFAFDKTADSDTVVLTFDSDCAVYADFCKNIPDSMQIAAVCRFMRIKI